MSRVPGLGQAKVAQICAAMELGRRLAAFMEDSKPTIHGPEDVAQLLMPELRHESKEHFKALYLDVKNRVLRARTVFVGTLDGSIVHPREIFRDAVTLAAASVIVAHNHPSGDPTPSPEDISITRRLVTAGQVIGIDLVDHVIIGDGRWVSLKERGLVGE
jgi:DNA repair protein RadC